jgi:predicted O-methyltransferase YrrM
LGIRHSFVIRPSSSVIFAMPIDLNQFAMNPAETALLTKLVAVAKPRRIAEFGSGLTTRFWAQLAPDARIVTWDNYPEWIAELKTAFAAEPWLPRVEWRGYTVSPDGPRDVEKDPVPWDGEPFDFLFLDGPRSAHPPNFGRSGTFRFATRHAAPGALIVWHDAQRPHEREMARRYFPHCARHREGSVGWCKWEPAGRVGALARVVRKMNPFA